MLRLKGDKVILRGLEPEDLDYLYELENNTDLWEISGTITPYSRHVLKVYLENAFRDIYEVKQLRLCICTPEKEVIGLVDLFDFDPVNLRVGLGLVISDASKRNQGVGAETIELICSYVFSALNLRQVYVNVGVDNLASLHLFIKMGFTQVGIKKDWILSQGTFKDEVLFQKLND